MSATLEGRRKWADFWVLNTPDPYDPNARNARMHNIYRDRAEAVTAALAEIRAEDGTIVDEHHYQPLEVNTRWTSTWWAVSPDDGSDQFSVSVHEGRFGDGF